MDISTNNEAEQANVTTPQVAEEVTAAMEVVETNGEEAGTSSV